MVGMVVTAFLVCQSRYVFRFGHVIPTSNPSPPFKSFKSSILGGLVCDSRQTSVKDQEVGSLVVRAGIQVREQSQGPAPGQLLITRARG